MRRALVLFLLAASPAAAQLPFIPRIYTVANLPTSPQPPAGYCYVVSDAATAADCSTGSGSRLGWCCSNGSAYVATHGAIDGPASAAANSIPTFSGTSGALLQDPALAYIASGKLGIGTGSPSAPLEVEGSGGELMGEFQRTDSGAMQVRLTNTARTWALRVDGAGTLNVRDVSAGVRRATWTSTGFLVGVSGSPAMTFHAQAASDTNVVRIADTDGTCDLNPESGSLVTTCSSGRARKKNIRDPGKGEGLALLRQIRTRKYETSDTDETKLGPVAEELLATAPDRVVTRATQTCSEPVICAPEDEDCLPAESVCVPGEDELAVKVPTVWELVLAIQDLSARVDDLEREVETLKRRGGPS